MIRIAHATKWYGSQQVVKDVSLTIQKHTLTTLIGSNGAGKSTLLSLIGRLIEGEGTFFLEDRDIASYRGNDLAKRIAMLKQTNHLAVRLTIKELVRFGRFPYSKTRLTQEDEAIVEQAIDYMDLKQFEHKYLDQLSGGERQRAMIAMVIAQNTDYILLDEPLNNLDMAHSVHIMKLLRRLVNEHGRTVVLVLHDINFASCYSDSIIAMRDGALVEHGTTEQVITTDKLQTIYGIHIPVTLQKGRRYCLYHL